MTDLEKLIELARKAREAFEVITNGKTLGGYCYDATCCLRFLAEQNGIKTETGEGYGHYFVLFNGDTVIDITSTQFEQPDAVAVLPLSEASKIGKWWELLGKDSIPLKDPGYFGHKVIEEMNKAERERNVNHKENQEVA